ncbi:D-galactarate dehydratase [Jannaschia rubra]|uniref:D-galactarate dehydratase n=1 Tax=Jannaschia rubra TaxID=282197 RepID=UPI0024908BC6|nr:D-galactarate dehydratase [Jannaschia rubra]
MFRSVLILPFVLGACAELSSGGGNATASRPSGQTTAPTPRPVLQGPSTSAAALDTVSEAEKAAARQAAASAPAGGELGQATVALGSPTDPGLWVKTSLVTQDTPGTVRTGAGDAIAVTLRPLGSDGGAQISLSALQALGLPLAGLHPVTLARAG